MTDAPTVSVTDDLDNVRRSPKMSRMLGLPTQGNPIGWKDDDENETPD